LLLAIAAKSSVTLPGKSRRRLIKATHPMKTPIPFLIPLLCAAIGIVTLASLAAACWQQFQGHTTDSNTGQTTVTFHVRTEHQVHTTDENLR
jgi:hypothetical protein